MPVPDGVLLINKPSGPTSYDMIRWIKRNVKDTKIGHAGTLDPLATGLLVILLGKATKRQSDVMGSDKIYRCALRFGVRTETGDITGKVLDVSTETTPDAETAYRLASGFVGTMDQMPPMYSALKRDGVPLYKLARAGKTVEREKRRITVQWLEPIGMAGADLDFRVRCSSGTYVRSLVEDMGARAGVGATMTSLVRESIGALSLDDAFPGEELPGLNEAAIAERVRPVAAVMN